MVYICNVNAYSQTRIKWTPFIERKVLKLVKHTFVKRTPPLRGRGHLKRVSYTPSRWLNCNGLWIRIRMSDPWSLRSGCVKRAGESTLSNDSLTPLMHQRAQITDSISDHPKGAHTSRRDLDKTETGNEEQTNLHSRFFPDLDNFNFSGIFLNKNRLLAF